MKAYKSHNGDVSLEITRASVIAKDAECECSLEKGIE